MYALTALSKCSPEALSPKHVCSRRSLRKKEGDLFLVEKSEMCALSALYNQIGGVSAGGMPLIRREGVLSENCEEDLDIICAL